MNTLDLYLWKLYVIVLWDLKSLYFSLWNSTRRFTCMKCLLQNFISFLIPTHVWLFICCKTKSKKNFFFFWKNICVFYKIYVICRKKCFYIEKKNYKEKYKWKCEKIYLISEIYFTQKMFVLQTKYQSFLNIYSFCKKDFFDH